MERNEILARNPLKSFLDKKQIKLRGAAPHFVTNVCPVTSHKPNHLCVTVDTAKGLFHCNDCDKGGTVIDWVMIEQHITAGEALKHLSGDNDKAQPTQAPQIVATYDYANENGELIFQVVRYSPKTFRQRQPAANGSWQWDLEGVTRVLYNLACVRASATVVICEGEKDCDTMNKLGWVATTNCGGAGKWLPAYSETLKGKHVVLIPDSDSAGKDHALKIIESLKSCVLSLRRVTLPHPHKDVTDFVKSFPEEANAKTDLSKLIESSPSCVEFLPVYTVEEMEVEYRRCVARDTRRSLSLSMFGPGTVLSSRKLIAGELMLLMADTGVGKTALLQTIARLAAPLKTLIFEMELPLSLMFERFVQMEVGCFSSDVEREYLEEFRPLWKRYLGLHHIMVCPKSGIGTMEIEHLIVRSELKFGQRPDVVIVDYVGLVRSVNSKSRYDAVSNAAEEMKVIAKRTETIIIMASQIGRPDKKSDGKPIGLHDARDSGALENSSGLVIACERPSRERIVLRILKDTKGRSGDTIELDFNAAQMSITPKLHDNDRRERL